MFVVLYKCLNCAVDNGHTTSTDCNMNFNNQQYISLTCYALILSPPISVQESIKIFGVINKQGEGVEISSERECGGLEKNSKINIRGGRGRWAEERGTFIWHSRVLLMMLLITSCASFWKQTHLERYAPIPLE